MENALQVLTDVAAFNLTASLETIVVVALVLLAQKLFGRVLSAQGRYVLWLSVIISLVAPQGFQTSVPTRMVFPALSESAQTSGPELPQADATPPGSFASGSVAPEDARDATATQQWTTLLSVLWLLGALAVLLMMLDSSRRFGKLVRRAQPGPQHLQALLDDCRQRARCRTGIRLLLSSELRAPVVTGVREPVLIWPTGLDAELSLTQLRHVFIHEVMHVKRLDIPGSCIVAALQALHWFNPVLWFAFSCLRQDREMACDAATVVSLDASERDSYVHTLIEMGALRPRTDVPVQGLAMLGSKAHLKRRLQVLLRQPRSLRLQQLSAQVLLLPLCALALCGFVPADGGAPAQATPTALVEPPVPMPAILVEVTNAREPEPDTPPPLAPVMVQEPATRGGESISMASAVTASAVTAPALADEVQVLRAPALIAAASTLNTPPAPVEPETLANAIKVATEVVADSFATEAGARLVCRRFKPKESDPWVACDRQDNWETFAQAWGIPPGVLPVAEDVPSGLTPPALQDALCRTRSRPASMVRNRICSSAAQWVAVDLAETGNCSTPGHTGEYQEICFALRNAASTASWNQNYIPLTMPSPSF